MNSVDGVWLSIIDYSQYKNTSISTIRRHIKNNILKYKEENGKYLIYISSPEKVKMKEEGEILKLRFAIEELKAELKRLKEENNEFKMLVDLYENQNSNKLINEEELVPELPTQDL